MPKTPKFQISQTPKGWRVNVPKNLSDTGKPQRRFFPSRRQAEEFAKTLRSDFRANGESAMVLPPRVADDAARAWMLLEPYGVSLTEAARAVVRERDRLSRSVTLGKALEAWEKVTERLRDRTKQQYKMLRERLGKGLESERLLGEIGGLELAAAIEGKSYPSMRRALSAFWMWAAKEPRGWCEVKEMEKVEVINAKNDDDISVMSPTLVKTLLRMAERLYPETVPLFAVGFFAGVRAEEIVRLTEEDFSEDGIEIGERVAKKRRRRHVPMNETLRAWLEVYPFEACADFRRKSSVIRRMCGWEVEPLISREDLSYPQRGLVPWRKNVIRHTHASAAIAAEASLEDLLFRFGHTGSAEVLRSHYLGRMTKKEAVAFWKIGPNGEEVELLKMA